MSSTHETMIVVSEDFKKKARELGHLVLRTPFTKRTWSELLFVLAGGALGVVGLAFVAVTMVDGVVLAITFLGFVLVALSVRGARGIGGMHRNLARRLLDEHIEDPEPFVLRPGFFGWLQSSIRDRMGWRSMAYIVIKAPLVVLAVFTAISVWFDALTFLLFPFLGGNEPPEYGLGQLFFNQGQVNPGRFHDVAVFIAGVILFFAAPWVVRAVIALDLFFMRMLLGPDVVAARVRSLEYARAQTVDASAATLRRIERDLHDGTQAQLVALAMRLGMAKEKLADPENLDLDQVRDLVNDAHNSAKEAIVELRDLARGIHPPALDIGLGGALSTLASRSTVPTEVSVSLQDRPTPAIEAIAYFCVAELLANVAQHANASHATVSCSQDGRWLRLVVRDDGVGGAQPTNVGSSSSGLVGLTDRVQAVDGAFDIVSPPRGPTVVTVDLPLHA